MKIFKFLFMVVWYHFTKINYAFSKKVSISKKKFRCIVLKPYFYMDLYTKSFKSKKKIIYSSYYRLGPVGLFLDLNSKFYITNSKTNEEQNIRIKNRIKSKEHRKLINLQKKNSIDPNKINFKNYDIAFCYEGAVDSTIIKKFPRIKWALILEDHSHQNYKKYLNKKPPNFDFFLNHTQGFTPYSLIKKKHSIDLSYTFGSSNFLKSMKIKKNNQIDVLVEIQQPIEVLKLLKKEKFKSIKLGGNLNSKKYINKLSSAKIFFCPLFTTPRWGNSIIEAAMCKNLIVGNKYSYWNSLIINDDLHCTNTTQGVKIIQKLLKDKNLYNYYLLKQEQTFNNINFQLPIYQIQKNIN